jgi:hypothetical protein
VGILSAIGRDTDAGLVTKGATSLVDLIRKQFGDDIDGATQELVRMGGFPESVARRIATGELPMDEASRVARREAQTRPETYYNGGNTGALLEVDPEMSGSARGMSAETGFWGADNGNRASGYAGNPVTENSTVYPFRVMNNSDQMVVDGRGSNWNLMKGSSPVSVKHWNEGEEGYGNIASWTDDYWDTNSIAHMAKDKGDFDSVLFRNIVDSAGSDAQVHIELMEMFPELKKLPYGSKERKEFMDALSPQDTSEAYRRAEAKAESAGDSIVVFDPNDIRSPNAAFDPQYTGPNIMGGAAGTAALAGLLAAPEEAEAGPKSQAAQEAIQGIMGMIDPRFDPRVRERERLAALTPAVSERGTLDDIPRIALSDLEGRQFITTMSDRTRAGGLLTGINDVEFDLPVNLQGGQDFMFENPGAVWASAPGVVGQIMREAYRSKDNPIYLPYRMAPTGGDFSKMTGETMISYASANMTQAQKRELDKAIRGYVTKGKMVKQKDGPSKRVGDGLSIEGWQGVDSPASIEAWRNTPDSVRKELMDMMDKQFRNKGGLGIGEARLAVADPYQVGLRDAGIQNVGLIFRDQPVIKESGHPSYPFAVPGEGLGRLDDQPMSIFDLIPDARLGEAQRRVGDTVDPLNPSASDIRAVSMKPYSGRIDEATLRRLEDRGVNVNSPAAVDAALMAIYAEDAHNIEVENRMRDLGLERDSRYDYGTLLPVKTDIVTGERSLAYPEVVRGLLGALIDLGSTPKTGVYNPNAILDIAL